MKYLALLATAATLALTTGAAQAAPTTMYQTDFTISSLYAGVNEVTSGAGAIGNVGANNYGGVTGNFLYNDSNQSPTVWTLTNLPAHTSLTVDFDAMFIDSWDSTNGTPAPDYYEIYLDGNLLAQMTSANASGNVNFFNGGTSTYFGNFLFGPYNDRVVDMSTGTGLTFAHTNSSFVLSIKSGGNGWQGNIGDESWGIDNLSISADLRNTGPVPEPASWALMILGFGSVGAAMRSRRRSFVAA